MCAAFSEQYSHFLMPKGSDIADAIKTGLVVFDANVLLSAYRFAPTARDQLFLAIERLADRAWIPHQVGLEFHRNRYEVIADYAAAYKAVLDAVTEHQKKVGPDLDQKVRFMSRRTGLTSSESDRLLSLVADSLPAITQAVEELRDQHGLTQSFSEDPVLERFQAVLDGKVGPPLSTQEEAQAITEAKRRVSEQIPPGYRDAKKVRPEGDYLVWLQTLKEAKSRNAKWLVFVTGDVKEDWFLREGNRTIAARPELTTEARSFANSGLILMETQTFLFHAKDHLSLSVSADTLQQAGRIVEAVEDERAQFIDHLYIDVLTKRAAALERVSQVYSQMNMIQIRSAEVGRELASIEDFISKTGTTKGGDAVIRKQMEFRELASKLNALHREYELAVTTLQDTEAQLEAFSSFRASNG